MAFNKFDPAKAEEEPKAWSTPEGRRALILKYGWWISTGYVALGFGFIVYWLLSGKA